MKKLGLICLAAVVALGAMGVGYASFKGWTQPMTAYGAVATGELSWQFDGDPDCYDPAGSYDYTCASPNMSDVHMIVPNRDIGSTLAELIDDHTMRVTLDRVYPGYYTKVSFNVWNRGSIPLKVQAVQVNYPGGPYVLLDNVAKRTADGVFGFRGSFDQSGGSVIDAYSGETSMNLEIHLREAGSPVLQGHTYTFTVSIIGVQAFTH